MSCGDLERRGVWGRMATCLCMVESLCCPSETIITHVDGYTPIQNKKFLKIKKNIAFIVVFINCHFLLRDNSNNNNYLLLSCLGNGTPLQYSCLENPMDGGAWQAAVHGVAKSPIRLSDFTFSFHFHALQKEMATHSSVLAWRIPGTGKPGGLPSMGSHRVGHD